MQNAPPDAIDTSLVRRVLVTKLRHHGDVLLASPVFTVLKRALPSAEIDALVYRETAPMLEGQQPLLAIVYLPVSSAALLFKPPGSSPTRRRAPRPSPIRGRFP